MTVETSSDMFRPGPAEAPVPTEIGDNLLNLEPGEGRDKEMEQVVRRLPAKELDALLDDVLTRDPKGLGAATLKCWSGLQESARDALVKYALDGRPGAVEAVRYFIELSRTSPENPRESLVSLASRAPFAGAMLAAKELSNWDISSPPGLTDAERIDSAVVVAIESIHQDVRALAQKELQRNPHDSWERIIEKFPQDPMGPLLDAMLSIVTKVRNPSGMEKIWREYFHHSGIQEGDNPWISWQLLTILRAIGARKEKLEALALILQDSRLPLDALIPPQIGWAVSFEDGLTAARILVEGLKKLGHENTRAVEVAAFLMKAVTGSADAAGGLLNGIVAEQTAAERTLAEETIVSLRVLIGGNVAMAPILRAQSELVRKDFLAAVESGTEQVNAVWNKTVMSAQRAFTAKLWMSILVFAVGLGLTVGASWQVVFEARGEALWGPGISLATGLGAMLTVVFSRPLQEIAKSVVEFGSACAAMSAFVARVAEINYSFAVAYSRQKLDQASVKAHGDLLDDAARDALSELKKIAETLPEPKA